MKTIQANEYIPLAKTYIMQWKHNNALRLYTPPVRDLRELFNAHYSSVEAARELSRVPRFYDITPLQHINPLTN